MLLKAATLEGIARGEVSLAFRRWKRPTVKSGGTLRTRIGMLAIESVEAIEEGDLDERQARAAGHADLDDLLAALEGREGQLYRVKLAMGGQDPRDSLRDTIAQGPELEALVKKLAGKDRRSPRGAWTRLTLELIRDHPGRRAADLAEQVDLDKPTFKRDVRKLKELGLTISLETGYELSPRGAAVLASDW